MNMKSLGIFIISSLILGAFTIFGDRTSSVSATFSSLSVTPGWTADGIRSDTHFGLLGMADVNGDGYTDLIVGANSYDGGQTNEGAAYLYYGSSTGLSVSSNWMVESDQDDASFGNTVNTTGDVNGDGYADVIISAPNYDHGEIDEGRAFVYYGSATGLSPTADWTAEGDQAGAHFGGWVNTAGDVNGDGYDDVVIVADGYDNGQTDEGRAYLYYGSATGLQATSAWTTESDQNNANLHKAGTAGDVNGDGYDDLVIGVENYDGDQPDEGKAMLYYGSPNGLDVSPDWLAEGNQASALFGSSTNTAGDVNHDGYADVIIAAYSYSNGETSEGRAFVYYGSASGLSTVANWTAETDQAGASVGEANTAGDVNGDGYADVAIGSPWYDGAKGKAWVFLGSASGLTAAADWTAQSEQSGAHYGWPLKGGDVNRDGASDLAVGAHAYPNYQRTGRSYLYYGSPASISTPTNTLIPTDTPTATVPCPDWNLATDFRVSPNQENPNRDSCGNLNVWYFLENDPNTYPAHLPAGYTPLPEFITDLLSISGLEQWQGSVIASNDKDKVPALGINNTGVTQHFLNIIWPPDLIRFHPLTNSRAIVGWRSPINGTVMVDGGVNSLDNSCGDSISWFIDHYDGQTNTTLAYGSIPVGGSQNFSNGVNGASLASILVNQGNFLYFIGDPNGNFYCDTTGLTLIIRPVSTATPTNTVVPSTNTPLPTDTPTPTNTLALLTDTPTSTPTSTFTTIPTPTTTATATGTPTAITSLHITTESPLPNGTVGMTYMTQLVAAGGALPYIWSVVADNLPSGLTMSETTGEISGTPSSAGSSSFTVQVMDNTGTVATKQFVLTIQALFTDLGVNITELQFEPAIATPGQPATIKAKVRNLGLSDATDIQVDFAEFGTLLQQTTIPSLPAGMATEVTFETTYTEAGLRLISVKVDPDNQIPEHNENNNEASKVLQVGQPDLSQATMVIQAAAITICRGQVVAMSGQAYYDFIQVPGQNDYPVQGGSVTLTLLDPTTNNRIGVFSGIHTDMNGQFSQAIIAPASDGAYPVRVEVTDQTLTLTTQTTLTVSGPCPVPPPVPPPPPPPPPGQDPPPPNGPPVRDVYVRAEDIYFTESKPNPGETIQIFAYIYYYGTEQTPDIPVTLYDILPVNGSLAKVVIGAAQISFQNGANGPAIVSIPWTSNPAGAHIIQAVVEPPFTQFTQNDKATRLIFVGDMPQLELQKSLLLLLDADDDGKISPGDKLQYTISYRNNGKGEVTNAVILDDYDEGLLALPTQLSHGGAVSNGVITWHLGTLVAGASSAVTYQVEIIPAAEFPSGHTRIGNIALLTTDQAPPIAASAEVEVRVNRAPMIGVELPMVTKDEGETATNHGAVSDADGDMVTLIASVGTVVNNGDGTWSWNFNTSDGPVQSQTVTISTNDGHGGASQTNFSLVVNNVVPSVGEISAPMNPQPVGVTINTDVSFSDSGVLDTHTAVWEWDDGTTSVGVVNETNGSGSVSGSHTYATAGIYTIKVTVTDDDGGSNQSVFRYVVVYDPSAGFVTGGGWIDSPTGAYAPDPSLTGKANFGFVSKYKKGTTTPTGQTEFQFKIANLNFHSTSYDWLVVAGAKAQYKGSGAINGSGNYGFLITAIDGALNGGGGNDKFRIKIWDKSNGDTVVYDNKMEASEDSDAATAIGGGSIVIHKGGANAAAADNIDQTNAIFLPLVRR